MAITFSAIFARRHGAALGYAVLASFGNESAIIEKFREITDASRGAAFREEHAEVQLIRDTKVVDHFTFDDPAVVEKQRIAALQRDAAQKRDAARKAAAVHKEARANAQSAAAAFSALSDEQKQYLTDLDKAQQAAEAAASKAQREAAVAAETEAARAEAARKEQEAEAAKHASDSSAGLDEALKSSEPPQLEPPALP